MIVYDLVCAQGHRFEGWFASGEEFTRQREASMVSCPLCDDAQIERVPSAKVSVRKGHGTRARAPRKGDTAPAASAPASTVPEEAASPPVAAGMPAEMLAKLREIVKQTENVGRRFAEEARKIHYEETPPRAIRGQASAEEAKALNDEGIDFAPVPPILLPDTH